MFSTQVVFFVRYFFRIGGIMSIFLLGAYNPSSGKWCTVTKCHSGLDDKTLEELQTSLDMVKISKNADKVRLRQMYVRVYCCF